MPFQKGHIGTERRHWLGVGKKYTSIDDVMDRNEQLEAENAELRQQMVDYDRIKAENDAYKALARIQDSNTEASYISAFVIGRDPLDEFGGFTLDCGTVNGAAVNDAVISDKGLSDRHGGGSRHHQLQSDDHSAPQLQRSGRDLPHAGKRHHHRQRRLCRRRSVRADQSGPRHLRRR